MISAVAFCPHPPALVPALAGPGAVELTDVLAACDAAVAELVRTPVRVLVLGAADRTARVASDRPAAFGEFGGMAVDGLEAISFAETPPLPLSLAIGSWLLFRARPGQHTSVELWGVAGDDDPDFSDRVDAAEVLLVMGDGSARRGLKAPGYLDDRAAGFDTEVAAALQAGNATALAQLNPDIGSDVLAAGVPAWRAAGRLLSGTHWHSQVTYSGDPFGVQYFVALWTAAASS